MTSAAPAYAVVTTTADAEAKARFLAAEVIGDRLAACAQVYPVSSVYRWEGKVEQAQEWRVDFKTRGELVERLAERIGELHDYDTPEIIAVPVVAGSAGYLAWVGDETRG
ncbi:divalent-cation tolerance protein CutA [Streptomyces morookaense]|uniref:Divalent-cation tolerance protein CutA n=1 Tax=Streptomyces morookaense TaxID=1970 RepID=A0A7Y7E5F9_STRMO|nr:divalent-cation tolerance protein CutA [Streptomyces morookaense]NVK76259.1 divalent-cation tolerance protein CutA [Streptomyces morookaense]GHF38562.1 divalent cation tolerance protein [Streptomyces morookaense]